MKTKKERAIPSPNRRSARTDAPNARFSAGSCQFCGLPSDRCKATVDHISSSSGAGYTYNGPTLHNDQISELGVLRNSEIRVVKIGP